MIEKDETSYAVDAIWSIRPNAEFSVGETYASLNWIGTDQVKPTEAEFDTALASVKAGWTAKEYARNRQAEYPDFGSQLNKIYDDGITKWKAEMVDPVKTKWPKDNSGPK